MTATRHVLDCARACSNPEGPPRYVPPALCIGPITIFSTKAAAGAAGPPPPPRRRQRRWRQGQRGHHQYRGGGDGASGGSTKFGCQVSRNSYLYSTSTQPLESKCKVNMQPEPTVLRFVVENNIDATCKTETGKRNRTTLPRLSSSMRIVESRDKSFILDLKLFFTIVDCFSGKFPPRFFTVKLVCFIGFPRSSYLVLFNFLLCMILT